MIDIDSLIGMGANIRLELTPEDLRMFAESVVQRTIMAHEKMAERNAYAKEETYIGSKEVCELLGICAGTLSTWGRRGYLVPIQVGGKKRYALSDVRRIQTGKRNESVTEYCKRKKRAAND